jgi:hypothetical protein
MPSSGLSITTEDRATLESRPTVIKWLGRFAQQGLAGLDDEPAQWPAEDDR